MRNFWRKGNFTLRKEIALVVAIKLTLIVIIWYFCFSDPFKNHLTSQVVQNHMLGGSIAAKKDR